jgi:hypothetical protein
MAAPHVILATALVVVAAASARIRKHYGRGAQFRPDHVDDSARGLELILIEPVVDRRYLADASGVRGNGNATAAS